MCLVIFSGYIVAVSGPVRLVLVRLVRLARTARGAVLLTAALSMSLAWVHWGLGLVAGAILAVIVSREHRDRASRSRLPHYSPSSPRVCS